MQQCGVNVVSIGMFAWSFLETDDEKYDFGWFDEVVGLLTRAEISIFMATPSGARPAWLAQRYPEVLRVNKNGQRNGFGFRHNHCMTSPQYRRKVAAINEQLARRYGHLDQVLLWHVSNEYCGECFCDLCKAAFREWLQRRYGSLEALNKAWWTAFWSHVYTDWSQVEPPTPHGEPQLHGLNLDWKRFTTAQTVDFMQAEIAALRLCDQTTPVTTNTMGIFDGVDSSKICAELDVVSWDAYPRWHDDAKDEVLVASRTGFWHDLNRSLGGGKPFLLMESTPSILNWQEVNRPKQPGMHRLSSLQAVAHGADSVQYFQWRASRGGPEKFHGAVVNHGHTANSRVFREVAELGQTLAGLGELSGATTPVEAAIYFDWDNRWAYEDNQSLRNDRKGYIEEIETWYHALWRQSIATDLIVEEAPIDGYKLVIAPLLYMLKDGVAERMTRFVEGGGCLLFTYGSGWVNDSDLIFEGGQLAPLRELLGIRVLETFVHRDHERVAIVPERALSALSGDYASVDLSELIEVEGAEVLARYGSQYFSGTPCLTRNRVGRGAAMYSGCRAEAAFVNDLVADLSESLGLATCWPCALPEGVHARQRVNGDHRYVFLMNFTHHTQAIPLAGQEVASLDGVSVSDESLSLKPLGVTVVKVGHTGEPKPAAAMPRPLVSTKS